MSGDDYLYVNELDWDGPDVTGARVFNAPRPLYGSAVDDRPVTWVGGFRAGRFYSAVWPDGYRANDMIAACVRDGAVEIRFVTNDQVREMVEAKLAEHGYSLADYAEIGMGMADVAAENGLGYAWHDEPS